MIKIVTANCPVCGVEQAERKYIAENDAWWVDCPACSVFVSEGLFVEQTHNDSWWTPVRRAALSHYIRNKRNLQSYRKTKLPFISYDTLLPFQDEGISLPNRLVQMENLIRYLGDAENDSGDPPSPLPDGLWAKIGAPSLASLVELFRNMKQETTLTETAYVDETLSEGPQFRNASLSLRGWQKWNDIHEGDTSSSDGFIAMQFGDERLDMFIKNVVEGSVAEELKVKIHRVNSPDKVKAGLIDNIMREAIEDAAFVIVELSHGNKGAYWEAGLAEGLRKPVIYICEQTVWDDEDTRPHFDVNHRTTVMWDENAPDKFVEELTATIKNSLR